MAVALEGAPAGGDDWQLGGGGAADSPLALSADHEWLRDAIRGTVMQPVWDAAREAERAAVARLLSAGASTVPLPRSAAAAAPPASTRRPTQIEALAP